MYKGIYYQPAMSGTELQLRKNVCELAKSLSPLEFKRKSQDQDLEQPANRVYLALRDSIMALLGRSFGKDFFRYWDDLHANSIKLSPIYIEIAIAQLDWTQCVTSEQYLFNLDWQRYSENMREQERIFNLKGYYEVTDRWPNDMTIERMIRIFKDGPHDLEIYHDDQFGEKPSERAKQAFNERSEKIVESMNKWLTSWIQS